MSISQLPEAVHRKALLGSRRQSLEHEKKALGELLGSTGVFGLLFVSPIGEILVSVSLSFRCPSYLHTVSSADET